MSLQKILCPVDFSAGSQQAMRMAVRIAAETGAALLLVHAWYLPPVALMGEVPFPPDAIQQLSDEADRALALAVKDATHLGATRVTSKVVAGVPWSAIVDLANDDPAVDLIVIGTHGRTGVARILLGSVAEQVIRHAACSVLAVRPDGEVKPFTHLLCPTDFSEHSQHAQALAAALVRPGGAGITLLHVLDLPRGYTGEPDLAHDLERRSKDLLETWAAQLRSKVSVPVGTRSRHGRPGTETLAMIDDDPSIDLVVMGSHGRTGLKRLLLGSVAEKVVRHARCPVLVARTRAR